MSPFFFGPPEHRLYGVYAPPTLLQRPSTQVLLCPPFGQEAIRTHRLYRLLAEQLSRQGMHVMRFDYFGTGESAGPDEAATLNQCRDDILLAHDELQLRTRAQRTVWLGTRLGATAAAMASEQSASPPDRLVLWEPILNGTAYLQELGEAHARETFVAVVQSRPAPAVVTDEVLGFGVSDAWLQQLHALTANTLRPRARETCIHLTQDGDQHAAPLATHCQATGGRWQQVITRSSIAWHTEEAGSAALAPPDLLRQLLAAATGASA